MNNFEESLTVLLTFLKHHRDSSQTHAELTRAVKDPSRKNDIHIYSRYVILVIIQMKQMERECKKWLSWLEEGEGMVVSDENYHHFSDALNDYSSNARIIREMLERRLASIKRLLDERQRRSNFSRVSDLEKFYGKSFLTGGELAKRRMSGAKG